MNPAQRAAVTAPDGPILVLAGAGSGKTRAIAHRIAFLIEERGVPPWIILSLTFTNKAAGEMRTRIASLLGAGAPDLWVFTFHALALRLLRRFGVDIGLRAGFQVYDEQDRRTVFRRVFRDLGLSEREFPIRRVAAAVSARKNAAYGAPEPGLWGRRQEAIVLDRIAESYQSFLDASNAVDFDDLLTRTVELLECSERARSFAEGRFRHVLVDEYQDTNRVQYRLLRLLAPHGNLFVVGDEDQSIYNFRGADLRNILDFERDFPRAQVFKLEQNYRSTGGILEAASALIANNQHRKGKKLSTDRGTGRRPRVLAAATDLDEANMVADHIEELRRTTRDTTAAVLVRTHAQTRLFEEEFVHRGIPHVLVGGQRFYERREVKDVLAYLRLIVDPNDDANFLRAINTPPRGLGPATLSEIEGAASDRRVSLWEAALSLSEEKRLAARAERGLTAFRQVRESLAATATDLTLATLVEDTVEQSGIAEMLRADKSIESETRLDNLAQLAIAASDYEARESEATLGGFLDAISLLTDLDLVQDDAACWLMTLHSAKGLEFDAVFLTGLEEGLFPHFRSVGDRRTLEEERRLCYVGMTRARRELILTYARSRRSALEKEGRTPSRFLREIPGGLLEKDSSVDENAPVSEGAVVPGARVRHPMFGEGTVMESEPPGREQKVTVRFARVGRKKLVARFANLELLAAPPVGRRGRPRGRPTPKIGS